MNLPTALILSCLGFFPALLLCNCMSTVNQYVARQALVTEEALMLESPISELWLVDGKYYARAYLGKGRGIQRGVPIRSIFYQEPDYSFRPEKEAVKEVYAALSHGQNGDSPAYFSIRETYLTTLPAEARHILRPRPATPVFSGRCLRPATTDARRYYAYPMAAIAAICIDMPASVIMTAAAIPSVAIGGTCAAVISSCRQTGTSIPTEH